MSLTPEESRRIYEEEKARIEAQEQLKKEQAANAQRQADQQRIDNATEMGLGHLD